MHTHFYFQFFLSASGRHWLSGNTELSGNTGQSTAVLKDQMIPYRLGSCTLPCTFLLVRMSIHINGEKPSYMQRAECRRPSKLAVCESFRQNVMLWTGDHQALSNIVTFTSVQCIFPMPCLALEMFHIHGSTDHNTEKGCLAMQQANTWEYVPLNSLWLISEKI